MSTGLSLVLLRMLATAVSAVAVGLSFPPTSARGLVWIGLVPWLLAIRGARPGLALALTWGWTVLAAWVIGSWMPDAVANYFLQSRALGYVFFFGVTTGMAGVFYMAFAAVYRVAAGRIDPRVVPLVVAAAWVAAELGRARLLTAVSFVSNPWGLLGYSQVGFDAAVQIASVTGVYGTSFAIVAANAGLVEAIVWLRSRRGSRAFAAPIAGFGVAPAAVVLAFGAWTLPAAPEPSRPADGVPIGIVQGDVSLGRRWRSDFYGQNVDVYLRGTREALAAEPGALVVWPESALTFFLEEEPSYLRAIARTLAARDGELVVGGPRREAGSPSRYFNSVFVFDSAGRLGATYDKQHLVPFTEYAPLGRFDFVRRRFEGTRFFTHGAPSAPLPTRAGPAGILLCNEAMLPEVASARTAAGATVLLVPSNDTWIPSRSFAEPLFDIVRMRAVEQRRWLVRASTSGPSAIIDPWGRVQARSEPFSRATVTGWVRPEQSRSIYSRLGDSFAIACAVFVAIALARSCRYDAPPAGTDATETPPRTASRGPNPATR